MVEEYAQYGITCKGDGAIDQVALRIADEDVILEGEATQCSIEMDRKSVSNIKPSMYRSWMHALHTLPSSNADM